MLEFIIVSAITLIVIVSCMQYIVLVVESLEDDLEFININTKTDFIKWLVPCYVIVVVVKFLIIKYKELS